MSGGRRSMARWKTQAETKTNLSARVASDSGG